MTEDPIVHWSTQTRQYFAFVLVLMATCCGLNAQQASSSEEEQSVKPMVIKKTVRRVILDVVVTDSNGKPALGLGRDDFSVAENGKTQRILSFDVHNFNASPDFLPPKLPSMPANTFINVPKEAEKGPLYAVLYDMVNMEINDQPHARKQLLEFINNKPFGTRFAIFVLSDGLHLVQGFTDDSDHLAAALNPRGTTPHVPQIFLYGQNFGKGNTGLSISVFTQIARYLAGLPGRKNLIWMSGKFPLSVFASSNSSIGSNWDFSGSVKEVINTMARDQIALYPVDIRGVVVDNPRAPAGSGGPDGGVDYDARNQGVAAGSPPPASGGGSGGAGPGGPTTGGSASGRNPFFGVPPSGPGYSLLYSDYMTEDEIAYQTGGRAYYSRNDLNAVLTEATEAGGTYYTLTYAPSNEVYDGRLRKIEVGLAKRGYKLAYRRSYFGTDSDSADQRKVTPESNRQVAGVSNSGSDSLYAYMQHGAPTAHDLIFAAHVSANGSPSLATPEQMAQLAEEPAYFRVRHHNRPPRPLHPIQLQTYAIDYRVLDAQLRTQTPDGSHVPSLELAAAAFDSDGRMLNGVLQSALRDESVTHQPGAKRPEYYRAQQQLDVPLNAAWIRIVVRDPLTDRIGALEIPLPLTSESPNQSATR